MAETTGNDLVSKCVAIQYGLLVAGVVLLLVATWSWYQNWSSACVSSCTTTNQACKASCHKPPMESKTSSFSSHHEKMSPMGGRKLTENMLHEGFMDYKAESSDLDFDTVKPDDPDAIAPYDPAADTLDKSVFDSHKEFVDESYTSTQGPNSGNIERDDTNEVVKRWGLRRVDYTSVASGDDARTVSSEYPSQVQQGKNHADVSELF